MRRCRWAAALLAAVWAASSGAIVVNTGEDGVALGDGKTTLRDALAQISAAAADRTVTFDVPSGIISLTNELTVPAGVSLYTIDGFNGGTGVTICQTAEVQTNRLLRTNSPANLLNLTFSGGYIVNGMGGAVLAEASLFASNCVFRANTAPDGGALSLRGQDSRVFCCTFEDNTSDTGGGGVYLAASGTMLVRDSTFLENRANGGMGKGGAVLAEASLFASNCVFRANTAPDGGALYLLGQGGGVSSCTFDGNTSDGSGGGVFLGVQGTMLVRDSAFLGNCANGGMGGAVRADTPLFASNCVFRANTSRVGGALYLLGQGSGVSSCTFDGNSSDMYGGGVYLDAQGTTLVRDSTFIGNNANGGMGGAVRADTPLFASNCVFRANTSTEHGGALYLCGRGSRVFCCTFDGNSSDMYGGGVYLNAAESIVHNCSFLENYASWYGGGIASVHSYFQAGHSGIVNCTFAGNRVYQRPGADGVYVKNLGTYVLGCSVADGCDDEEGDHVFDTTVGTEEELFEPGILETVVGPVTHRWRRPLTNAGLLAHGMLCHVNFQNWAYVYEDDFGLNEQWIDLIGSVPHADTDDMIDTDQLGRTYEFPLRGAVSSDFSVRVKFRPDYSGAAVTERFLRFGDLPTQVDVATRPGHVFLGWYWDADGDWDQDIGGRWFDAMGRVAINLEDALGYALFESDPMLGEVVLHAHWVATERALIVTTTALESSDRDIALPDAFYFLSANPELTNPSAGNTRTITFDVGEHARIELEEPLRAEGDSPFAVDGRNGGNGVTLTLAADGTPCALVENTCAGLELRNLAFEGGEAENGGAVRSTTRLSAVNCAFRRNAAEGEGGAVWSSGAAAFSRCTFLDNSAARLPDARVERGAFTNCTFLGSVAQDPSAHVGVAAGGAADVVQCTFSPADGAVTADVEAPGGGTVTRRNSLPLISANQRADTFGYDGEVRTLTADTVEHSYLAPLAIDSVVGGVTSIVGTDQLGRPEGHAGRGAVRSEFRTDVTLTCRSGTINDPSYPRSQQLTCGDPVPAFPSASWDLYDFTGWSVTDTIPYESPLEIYALWFPHKELAVVTSSEDGEDGAVVTFRDAVREMSAHPDFRAEDGTRTIRFALAGNEVRLSSPVAVNARATAGFAIDGENGGRGISVRTKTPTPLFDHAGTNMTVTLRNLTFDGGAAGVGDVRGAAIDAVGSLVASNCAFRGNESAGGGVVRLHGTAAQRAAFLNCTFADNVASWAGGETRGVVVQQDAAAGAAAAFTNCTFTENRAAGAVAVASVSGTAALKFAHCTFAHSEVGGGVSVVGSSAVVEDCLDDLGAADPVAFRERCFALGGAAQTGKVGVVTHVWYAPLASEEVVGGTITPLAFDQLGRPEVHLGKGAVRSEFRTLATFDPVGGRPVPAPRELVCGDPLAGLQEEVVRNGYDFAGWIAMPSASGGIVTFCSPITVRANWNPRAEVLLATTGEDGENLESGRVTLRDALRAVCEHPGLLDADGLRRVTVREGVGTVSLTGSLRVVTGAAPFELSGNGAILDVKLGSGDFRLLEHGGGWLVVENLTFAGGKADGEGGGAVFATGPFAAENCLFRRNASAATGGAVELVGASNSFLCCSFADNTAAGFGGAVRVRPNAKSMFAYCTFTGNSAQGGGALDAEDSALAIALSSTFVNNLAAGEGGAVRAPDPAAFRAYGCLFAGNGASGGTPNLPSGCAQERTTATDRPADDFLKTRRSVFVNGVDHQIHEPMSSEEEEVANGLVVWHDRTWENVAWSSDASGAGRQPVVGRADLAVERVDVDEVGTRISAYLRGAVTAEESSLTVTTAEDSSLAGDGKVSLREAFSVVARGGAAPDAEGWFEIRVADSVYVDGVATLNVGAIAADLPVESGAKVRIRGPDDGFRSLRIRMSGGRRLVCRPGGELQLQDVMFDGGAGGTCLEAAGTVSLLGCTFDGCDSQSAPLVQCGTSGTLVAEKCSWHGNRGLSSADVQGRARFVNCTFTGNANSGLATVTVQNGGQPLFVNCTLESNTARMAAVMTSSRGHARLLNCIAVGNTSTDGNCARDLRAEAPMSLYYVTYTLMDSYEIMSDDLLVENCVDGALAVSGKETGVFSAVGATSRAPAGVPRWYRPPMRSGKAEGNGCCVWHDASWTNVAFTKDAGGSDKTTVLGHGSSAGIALADDILDRPVKHFFTPGSYATLRDVDLFEPGRLVVDVVTDAGPTESSEFDGAVSLREAVDAAQTIWTLRDVDGNCEITFSEALFKGGSDGVLKMVMPQIEVTGFTNGELTVKGPAELYSLVLDGSGTYRLFHVAAGNRVRFENLVFTNAVGQISGVAPGAATLAGGAIHNAGDVRIRNCAFRECRSTGSGYAQGGAVCTVEGATTVVERCTFADCSAGRGGALFVRDRGRLVAVGSTFSGNRAVAGSVAEPKGGAVCVEGENAFAALVNCTVAGNSSETVGGGLAVDDSNPFEHVSDAPTLHLLNVVAVGNTAKSSGVVTNADIHANGKTRLVHVLYGARNDEDDKVWSDTASRGGFAAADVFAVTTTAGAPVVSNLVVNGMAHAVFPLRADFDCAPAWVSADERWENAVYGDANPPGVAFFGLARRGRVGGGGVLLQTDLLGENAAPFMGSSAFAIAPQEPEEPSPEVDPLQVQAGTAGDLLEVLRAVAKHPEYAKDGAFTVSFAPGVTEIEFSEEIHIAAGLFSDVPLRIRGDGVTFKPASGASTRFFRFEAGTHLQFEGITFAGGSASGDLQGCGGAICLTGGPDGAFLEASNCTFRANVAQRTGGGFGGAIFSEGDYNAVTLRDCVFEGNSAPGGKGQDVYRTDRHLALYGCTAFSVAAGPQLVDAVGEGGVRARVERANGRIDYFDSVEAAIPGCIAGDTLVMLDEYRPKSEDVLKRLPWGVTLVDGTDGGSNAELLSSAKDALAAELQEQGVNYLAARVSAGGQLVLDVTETARPELEGEDAYVDLDWQSEGVLVWPANVKPNLEYGLGWSETADGEYAVGKWVRADGNGDLPTALTAPKTGSGGFYKVLVRP